MTRIIRHGTRKHSTGPRGCMEFPDEPTRASEEAAARSVNATDDASDCREEAARLAMLDGLDDGIRVLR